MHSILSDEERAAIDAVVEEHRIKAGASRLHVSLGPNATAESVRRELERCDAQMAQYAAIPEVVRLKARVKWLEDRIQEIGNLAVRDVTTFLDESDEVRRIKSDIFSLTDCIPDADIPHAIAFAATLAEQEAP